MNNSLPWVIAIAIFIIVYRFAYYAQKVRFLEGFLRDYEQYMKKEHSERADWQLAERIPRLKRLLSEAGVQETTVPRAESFAAVGTRTFRANVVDNFLVRNGEIMSIFLHMIHQALGYFKWKRDENRNPVFWIDFVIRLPKYVMEYFNVDVGGPLYKLIQLVYWIVAIPFMLFSMIQIIRLGWAGL